MSFSITATPVPIYNCPPHTHTHKGFLCCIQIQAIQLISIKLFTNIFQTLTKGCTAPSFCLFYNYNSGFCSLWLADLSYGCFLNAHSHPNFKLCTNYTLSSSLTECYPTRFPILHMQLLNTINHGF